MKFIFWQNIVSPHQSYFLRKLSEKFSVVLIVETMMEENRVKQGWEIPDLGKTELIVIKDINDVAYLFPKKKQQFHFFSGIQSYPLINKAFSEIVQNQKVNIIVESPIQLGVKKWIRYFLYRYYAFKYAEKIDNIFAMGDLGVNWYIKAGFNKQNIHRFQYTIEIPNDDDFKFVDLLPEMKNKYRFTFIGQLIKRKGIDNLIRAFSKVKSDNWSLNIIGTGVLQDQISNDINKLGLYSKINLLGVKNNRDAMSFLVENTDYLILPSRFDGWGAVINEALSRGVKVITNEKCGASCLIKNDFMGKIYEENNQKSLIDSLEGILSKPNEITSQDRQYLSHCYKIENQDKVVLDFIDKFVDV